MPHNKDDTRKGVRIIAFDAQARKVNNMRVVNVFTTKPPHNEFPEMVQETSGGDSRNLNTLPTVMASGAANPANTQGLPNVYVNGYTGPQ